MKSITILAAVAAVATASAVPTYRPLVNAGTSKCIVAGDYDSELDEYTVALGDCDEGVAFKRSGKKLQTEDDYCLVAVNEDAGAPVVLAACGDADESNSWKMSKKTNQWKNGYALCLDYDSGSETMVQDKCQSPVAMGSTQVYSFLDDAPTPAPPKPDPCPSSGCPKPDPCANNGCPPPPPAPVTCTSWSKKWLCPKGYALIPKPDYTTCAADGSNCVKACCYVPPPPPTIPCSSWGSKYYCPKGYGLNPKAPYIQCLADGSNCVQQCCVPAPTWQLCGQWSVKNGGPVNSCGAGYTYVAGDNDKCALDGSDCQKRCCKPTPPPVVQKCGEWSVKNGGPINSCGTGYTYTAGDSDTCSLDGSNCKAKCCSQVQTWPCMSWSIQNGGPVTSCPDGTVYTASPSDTCNFEPSNCADVCCGPPQ